jgi:soluble lytic murein transglycosylase
LKFNLPDRRITFVAALLITLTVVVALTQVMNVSCGAAQRPPAQMSEAEAIERMRLLAHGASLPPENLIAEIETQHPNTRAAALARVLRAKIRAQSGNHAGAVGLLDADFIRRHTQIGEYALFMRADALERAGRRTEARAAFEELARTYPTSLRARDAILRNASLALQDGAAAAVPLLVRTLAERDDAAALLLTARAFEQTGDATRARAALRRIYFFAPASAESTEAASRIATNNSVEGTADEMIARANKFYDARRWREALATYTEAHTRFPQTANGQANLRRGMAAFNADRAAEAIAPLRAVPSGDAGMRAEALYYLTQSHAKLRQWAEARAAAEELRRTFPQSSFAPRAIVAAGMEAKAQNNSVEANNFFRAAIAAYPNMAETANAQFEIAWAAHTSRDFASSSQLLIEHLANYADKNTDNRGRAGYWAARDAERAGRMAEARALYEAMQQRYDANWYGHLAKQQLDRLGASAPRANPAPDSLLARAVQNLSTVTVAEESTGANEEARVVRSDELAVVGLDDWAFEELSEAGKNAPDSPRVNLAVARLRRVRGENVLAINALRRSFPDYAQMKPEEMTREEWDVFYPLTHWNIITEQARARSLDPYMVAGLIRQESVFEPRAISPARAYGLMQVLVETGQAVARRHGINRTVTTSTILEPQLNIQLGTAYMREQLNRFGRIEYLAAAYNAGPGRAVAWRASLPAPIDEWAEAVPFRETRGYIQGVVRNMLQYRRLYDMNGQFRPEVGTRAVRQGTQSNNSVVRPRRVGNEEDEE